MNDEGSRFILGHAAGDPASVADSRSDTALAGIEDPFGDVSAPVALVAASDEELRRLSPAVAELQRRGIACESYVLSPHRTAEQLGSFSRSAMTRGVRVVVAAAGEVAILPVAIASMTEVPVIAIPFRGESLGGLDALLAAVQSPNGVPVACVGLDAVRNAAVLASQMLNAVPMAPIDGE